MEQLDDTAPAAGSNWALVRAVRQNEARHGEDRHREIRCDAALAARRYPGWPKEQNDMGMGLIIGIVIGAVLVIWLLFQILGGIF